jgi:hypothetical protein
MAWFESEDVYSGFADELEAAGGDGAGYCGDTSDTDGEALCSFC